MAEEQILGPAQDTLIATDGKKLRHAQGVELVSAFGVQSGRWMGTVCTKSKSNEIPAARELLGRLDLVGKTVVADALHTQVETARQIVFHDHMRATNARHAHLLVTANNPTSWLP